MSRASPSTEVRLVWYAAPSHTSAEYWLLLLLSNSHDNLLRSLVLLVPEFAFLIAARLFCFSPLSFTKQIGDKPALVTTVEPYV